MKSFVRGIAVFALASLAAASADAATYRFVPRTAAEKGLVRARAAANSPQEWVEDYGSFVVVHGSVAWVPPIAATRGDLVALEEAVHLPGMAFDPLADDPSAGKGPGQGFLDAAASGPDDYIVQFAAPVKDAWRDDLTSAGVRFVQYVAHQAFLVRADGQGVAAAQAHPRVRWVGRYQPAYKIPAVLAWVYGEKPNPAKATDPRDLHGHGAFGPAIYDVAVAKIDRLDAMARWLTADGAVVKHSIDLPGNYFNVLRVELQPQQVAAVASRTGVITIDPWRQPVAEDEIAAQIVAGNYTGTATISTGYDPGTQFGVTGSTVTVAVVDDGVGIPGDGGFYITTANAIDGPLRGAAAGAQGHGHLNATIIAGTTPYGPLESPSNFNFGLGVAPAANIINIPLLAAGYSGVEADTANDVVVTNGPNGVAGFVSNNSWGNGTNANAYDSYAAQFDGFVRDATAGGGIDPLLLVFSAGNSGTSGLTRPKVAKNLIATAATENVRPTRPSAGGSTGVADNLEQLPDFSSRGPAADTRVKPDLAAPGDAVTGGRSGTDTLFGDIDTFHRISSGTSHAAPQVAGAAALFTQFWKAGHAGTNPSPALVKAALINSTVDVTGTGATAARPNGAEGWGRVKLNNILNTGVATIYKNQDTVITNVGDIAAVTGTVSSAAQAFRVSLVWTDPPGASDPALVNNLDLEVTVGGNTYRGNVFSGGFSTTGGVADTRNNIENVFLAAGITAGSAFGVTVRATGLNGDGALGTGDATDQHYALVIYNGTESSAPVPSAGTGTLTGENCVPANNAMDPNEAVSVSLCVQNAGTLATTNLVGTLQATGSVTGPSGPATYGAIAPAGSACQTFTFGVASGAVCGSTVTATLQLQDGATNHGNVVYTFPVGTTTVSGPTAFANASSITIPSSGNATPFPSTIAVSGLSGDVSDVDVTLTSFDHTFPADVDIVLVGPAGQQIQLMADKGGSTDAVNVNLTFDDEAAGQIGATVVSGTFKPSPGTYSGTTPTGAFGTALTDFDGTNPNGTWSLYVFDDLGGDSGDISSGWSLSITTAVPSCNSGCTVPVQLQSFDVD